MHGRLFVSAIFDAYHTHLFVFRFNTIVFRVKLYWVTLKLWMCSRSHICCFLLTLGSFRTTESLEVWSRHQGEMPRSLLPHLPIRTARVFDGLGTGADSIGPLNSKTTKWGAADRPQFYIIPIKRVVNRNALAEITSASRAPLSQQ